MNNNLRVVVTFTSWRKRIDNCASVIDALLKNTTKPDIIYLNLSVMEFSNKFDDLPPNLVALEKVTPQFFINWVDGPNTKSMKKVFPILQYLDDDDIIIYIDDDFILPKGFIQSRINDFNANGQKYAISGNSSVLKNSMLNLMTGIKLVSSSQPSSLVTKRMLYGYELFSENEDVYTRSADDSLYTLLVTLNGFSYIPCSDYGKDGNCQHQIKGNFNPISPLKTMGVFAKNGYSKQNTYITHLLYFSLIKDLSNKNWNQEILSRIKAFRRFRKPENEDFHTQIENFKTVNIDSIQHYLTYWYWKRPFPEWNAGDDYNQYLIGKLYTCKTIRCDNPDICLCGSILTSKNISRCKYIVGAGIQNEKHINNIPRSSTYLAVRGKTTVDILRKHGIDVDDNILLCDPGLLLSLFYTPSHEMKKQHKIGIIPHYLDEPYVRKSYGGKYHIISMNTWDIEKLVDDILSCEVILSSSLHGIIFAHSYGIPAYHIQIQDFFKNGNFKFQDYYSAFKDVQYRKFQLENGSIDVDEILNFHEECQKIANPQLETISEKQRQYLQVLPFRQFLKPNIIDSIN